MLSAVHMLLESRGGLIALLLILHASGGNIPCPARRALCCVAPMYTRSPRPYGSLIPKCLAKAAQVRASRCCIWCMHCLLPKMARDRCPRNRQVMLSAQNLHRGSFSKSNYLKHTLKATIRDLSRRCIQGLLPSTGSRQRRLSTFDRRRRYGRLGDHHRIRHGHLRRRGLSITTAEVRTRE